MANWQQMQQMVWAAFAQETAKWPPNLKQALARFEVLLIRDPGQVRIVAKDSDGAGNDPDVEKARDVLLSKLVVPLSRIVKGFGCRTLVRGV